MSIERTNPITGTEVQRRWLQANAAAIEAAEEGASIGTQEIHTSVDGAGLERIFRAHKNIGRTYHLGTVANEAAMLALDSPLTSHACLPGDTCFRTDTQQTMRCISNYGVSVGDWEVVSSSADPAGTADAAVSTHNTATDSHADIRTLVADRVPISTTRLGSVGNTPLTTTALSAADWAALPVGWRGIISAEAALASGLPAADVCHIQKVSNRDVSGGAAYQAQGYLSPTLYVGVAATSSDLPTWSVALTSAPGTTVSAVGAALLSLATPMAAKIPRINANGSVTLIDVPSGGGGGSGGWITHAGPPVGARTWVGNGDANGVVYLAGFTFGGGAFTNPCAAGGPMAILRSSNGDGYAQQLTDRNPNVSYSANIPGSWVCIDLGVYAPLLESYSLRHQSTLAVDYIRTWRLQGTNTISDWSSSGVNAASWTDLDVRSGDTTISGVDQWGHWVCNRAPSQVYRYLRLLQDGANSNGRHYLTTTEMEFYGALSMATPPPVLASGWLKSTSADLWMPYYGDSLDLGVVVNGYETAIGNPSVSGYLLSSSTAGVRSWVAPYSHPSTHAQSVVDSSAGWITTALASKAPLVSPSFTGGVSAAPGANYFALAVTTPSQGPWQCIFNRSDLSGVSWKTFLADDGAFRWYNNASSIVPLEMYQSGVIRLGGYGSGVLTTDYQGKISSTQGKTAAVVIGGTTLNFQNGVLVSYTST